jgi:NAD(P)-dependent dehydrogenase (short-subunit alcohol dehydrogenase family)
MTMRFDDRVVLVTGAGEGPGRDHALRFAARGARVVINDNSTSATDEGLAAARAEQVVEEIVATGGEAVASHDSSTRGEQLVQCALDNFGRIDGLVHHAQSPGDDLGDRMREDEREEFSYAHLKSALGLCRAAWPYLVTQQYGRLVLISSAAGPGDEMGRAHEAMVRMGLHGLCQTLALEGRRHNILANTLAPVANNPGATGTTPAPLRHEPQPEPISALVLKLCHDSHDQGGGLYEAAEGRISALRWQRSRGHSFTRDAPPTPESVREDWPRIRDFGSGPYPGDEAQDGPLPGRHG